MARPRKPAKELQGAHRITCPPYAIGYAILRPLKGGPRWYTRIGKGSYRATPYGDAPGAVAKVRDLLRQRIEQHLGTAPEVAPERAAGTPHFTDDLFEEYKAARMTHAGESSLRQLAAAKKHYLAPGLPVDAGAILRHITTHKSTLSVQSQNTYLGHLRQVFAYAVTRGYLRENPIDSIGVPKARNVSSKPRSESEMRRIRQWMDKHAPRRIALFYRLQSLTAMRYAELMSLTVGSIDSGWLRIVGKGDRVRHFPLIVPASVAASRADNDRLRVALIGRVANVLQELVTLMKPGDDRLFPYRRKTYVAEWFKRCRRELGEDAKDGRGTHTIRKYALWYYRKRLRLNRTQRSDLAGHSEKIARQHYEEFTPEELADTTMG